MGVSILVCGCGLKVRAAGATPGRLGRCPRCGGELRVPDDVPPLGGNPFAERRATMGELRSPDFVPPPERLRTTTAGFSDSDSAAAGYGLKPSREHAVRKKKGRRKASDITPPRTGFIEKKSELHATGGILPPLKQTESSWFGSILYPLRSADSLAVIASLTAILWLFTVLVPEYCLGLMGDADQMGAPTLGKLLGLVTILPVGFLLPFAIFYWLQYLGRVVVSSGMGETTPPRTPDRNFEGFLSGLSPWFTWLLLGVGVGLLPAALCRTLAEGNSPTGIVLTAAFACLAPPLHPDGLADDLHPRRRPGRQALRCAHRAGALRRHVSVPLRLRPLPLRRRRRIVRAGALVASPLLQNLSIALHSLLGGLRLDHDRRDAPAWKPLPSTPQSSGMELRPPAVGRHLEDLTFTV